jgi:riboflavin kinase/FMN adenylyltransferase
MQRVRLETLKPLGWPSPAVTIGNFDGVHRGHQALIAAAVEKARAVSGTAVVLTFDPHPAHVLSPDRAPAALTTAAQKAELLAGLGVDRLAVLPFTAERAAQPPEAFAAEVLAGALGSRQVVVGEPFRFGHRQAGDVARLAELGAELGFTVQALPPVREGGAPISSSRVREALAGGDVADARRLLGRSYGIDARVVRGEGRGRRIGIPTANLEPENEILPARGVYAGRCRLPGGETLPAVVNMGIRPTFGEGRPTLEAHLIAFEGDLYGAGVRLFFEERLRGERRFEGADALVAQIREDIARARALLSEGGGEKV